MRKLMLLILVLSFLAVGCNQAGNWEEIRYPKNVTLKISESACFKVLDVQRVGPQNIFILMEKTGDCPGYSKLYVKCYDSSGVVLDKTGVHFNCDISEREKLWTVIYSNTAKVVISDM